MTSADPTAAMLAEMGAVAHRLGMAFGREAERETDWARKRELFDLFDRCFFGVRVAISLRLRLARATATGAQPPLYAAREAEQERADPPETERPGRERPDADREREGERASLPLLLETLQGVAVDAAALPGPPPAALQPLTALLARATATHGPATRPAPGALRTRFAGASAVAMAIPPPRAGPAARGLPAQTLRPRAATGPPGR